MTVPIILLPAEIRNPVTAQACALTRLRFNVEHLADTDPYGGTEQGILNDAAWYGRFLVALARLTDEGRAKVLAARGPR